MAKKAAVLFSGGKDSNYSLFLAKKKGYEISCLLHLTSKNIDSYMFQTVGFEIVPKQAESLNIPILEFSTDGVKEEELVDLENSIKKAKEKYGVNVIITGAVKSNYQASRIQKICDDNGLECFNPIWQIDEETYLNKLIEDNFKVLIVKVGAYPLDKSFVGKIIDDKIIQKLVEYKKKYELNASGEGGEFETIVLNSPLFSKEIEIPKYSIKCESENLCYLVFEDDKL